MRFTIRAKLVLLSLPILVVVSFGFTLVQLRLSRGWVEEDLRERAIMFAREIAVTIGDRHEFESSEVLARQIEQIMDVRRSVVQLDVLAFLGPDSHVVATSHPERRLPFTRREVGTVRRGHVLSRLIDDGPSRYWEVIAPVTLDGVAVVGAVAAKFSLGRADALATRLGTSALAFTAASIVVMGLLMSLAVHVVVNRPLRRFMETIGHVSAGDTTATVTLATRDELGALARHFNAMLGRVRDFNDELQARVKDATSELEHRYAEVERLNELLFSMQRSLIHAERLALSGRIMAEVAHEVGTPLHSVAGHLELLRQDLPPAALTEGVRRRLDIVEGQLARVTDIIAQLLDLTRRTPGERSPVNLEQLVRDCVELVRPGMAAAGLALDITTIAAPPVAGHASQLQQVALNLITNAIDATPSGGRISITVQPRDGEVELSVADTGRGIPAAEQRQVFEAFFSTKEPGRGSGLGLFISSQIVREHGGRIEVVSAEGHGSTFRVVLPGAA
jgi:two-component system, NtrC family, sensor kinase